MENTKAIYKLHFDCGRQGSLNGLFVAKKEYVKFLMENKIEVYFGEVLGKHSEISDPIGEEDITMVSDNPEAIKIVEELELENGHNPFDYTCINFEHELLGEGDEDLTIREIICKILS